MERDVLLPCRSLGIVCTHRPHRGLSASSSSYTSPCSKSSHFDSLEMLLVGRLAQVSAIRTWEGPSPRKLNALKFDSEDGILEACRGQNSGYSKTLAVWAKVQEFEQRPGPTVNASSIKTDVSIWDQCRRVVKTEETNVEEANWLATSVMSRNGHAGFAAISARTYRPPPLPPPQRSKLPRYVTAGVFLSITAFIVWQVSKTEAEAREQLMSRGGTTGSVRPAPPQQTVSAFERAKASVAQTASVNRAVAAVRNNNFMECTIEMELALEENRLARTSIESDFYEEEDVKAIALS